MPIRLIDSGVGDLEIPQELGMPIGSTDAEVRDSGIPAELRTGSTDQEVVES